MREFKVGDEVRIVAEPESWHRVGNVGTITKLCDDAIIYPVSIAVEGSDDGIYARDELELVSDIDTENQTITVLEDLLVAIKLDISAANAAHFEIHEKLTTLKKSRTELKRDIELIKKSREES